MPRLPFLADVLPPVFQPRTRPKGRPCAWVGRSLAAMLGAFALVASAATEPKLKVGFIYVGPIGDLGWTRSHDDARKALERSLPWLETSYVESVNEGDFETVVDQMVQQGIKVIFAPSTTFMDGSLAAAAQHPDIMIFNGSGYKNAPNVATYRGDPYQCYYLLGLIAGALTKTDKVGDVASRPTPDSIRYINAFTIGLRTVRPQAVLVVRWINSWYDPPAAKEAAEAILSEGVDFLISDTDSPTVVEVAGKHHVPTNGFTFDMHLSAPDDLVSGDIIDWTPPYLALMKKIHDGVYTPTNLGATDLWWRLSDGVVEFAETHGVPINPKFKDRLSSAFTDDGKGGKISVYDLVLKRLAEMSASPPQFEPFEGPLVDAQGVVRVPAGRAATKAEIYAMFWRVKGVQGAWPNE
jgi:basic membrane protein A and related proteins